MLPLGTKLPAFTLPNAVDGRPVSSSAAAGKNGTLVMFICNHCPYVIHIRSELIKAAHEAIEQGISVVAINSNSTRTHPQDGPEHMKTLATTEKWRFPFLFDATQEVARAFHAECTPDLYLFDAEGRLADRGQFDDSRPANGKPITGSDLRAAIEAVVAGQKPSANQKPSVGCNIKWRS